MPQLAQVGAHHLQGGEEGKLQEERMQRSELTTKNNGVLGQALTVNNKHMLLNLPPMHAPGRSRCR